MKRIITMIAIAIMLTNGDLPTAEENASIANPIDNQLDEVKENEIRSRRNLFDYTLKTEEEVNAGCDVWFYLMDDHDNYVGWSSFLSIKDRFFTMYPSKDQAAYFRQCASPWKNAKKQKQKYMQAMYKGTGYWLTWSGNSMFLESIYNNDPNFGISNENSPVWFQWKSTGEKDKDEHKYWRIQPYDECWTESGYNLLFWWVPTSWTQYTICPNLNYGTLDKRLYFDYSGIDSGTWWKSIDVNQDCEGSWSLCTSKCEPARQRTFTQSQPKWGNGAACPAAKDCEQGEGDCKVRTENDMTEMQRY